MANYTSNLQLEKPEYNETADIEVINSNMDKIDLALKYQTASGTGAEIVLIVPKTLENGYNTTFIASANNGGAYTTVNGKPLYKPNTTSSPNITSGKAYNIWYNSANDCFFLKASAEGNAPQSSVLAGGTFSNDNDTGLVGTMNDLRLKNVYCGAEGINTLKVYDDNTNFAQLKITPSPRIKPSGFIDASTTFETHLSNLIPSNIKAGVTIADRMTGTFTSDATAQAGHILSGQSAYVNGNKINGNMRNLSSSSPIQHESNNPTKIIPTDGLFIGDNTDGVRRVSFRYSGENGFITGNTLFGLPEHVVASSLGIIANKIISGQNIAGVWGNATVESLGGRRFSSGSAYMSSMKKASYSLITMPWTLIGFKPSIIFIQGGYLQTTNNDCAFNTIAFNINGFNKSLTANVRGVNNNSAVNFSYNDLMYDREGDIKIGVSSYADNQQTKTFTWYAFE